MYFVIQLAVCHVYGQEVENITITDQKMLQKVDGILNILKFAKKEESNTFSAENNTFSTENNNEEISEIEEKKYLNTQIVTISSPIAYENLNEQKTTLDYNIKNKLSSNPASIRHEANNTILPIENNTYFDNYSWKLYKEFQHDNCLIIPYETSLLDWILPLIKVRTIIYPESHLILLESVRKFDAYTVLITKIEDLKNFLAMFYGTPNWNYRAKYLLIYHGHVADIGQVFKITWKHILLDVTLLIHNGQSIKIYTHFPYGNGSCGSNMIPVRLSDNSNTFPEKIPLDLKECDIKLMGLNIKPYVLDIKQPKDSPTQAGLEVTIIHNVFKKMNFRETYVSNPYPHWGYLMPDGNFTMTFKSLHDKEVDIIFGMIIGNETMEEHFDTTVSHIDTAAVWFVPTALQIAQWKNLTVIFDGIVWSSIFFVLILNAFAWWLIGKKRETSASYNELSLCLMGSFYILLQGSFTVPHAWKLRFVVLIWSMSSLLIFTAHQCQLTGIITSPLYEHQISNLKELVESDLDYGFYPILKDLYTDPNNWVHKKILNNFKPCSLTTECMNRTAFKRDFALIKNKRQGAYLMPIYYSFPSGKPKLYTFKESEFVVWCKYYVRRGFPFVKRIDKLIMLLLANGLVAKWDGDLALGAKVEDDPELEPLSLNHLQGAFFLLLFGYVLSTCLFLIEEYYKRFWDKNKTKDIEVFDDIN